jgi:hypothetical protein
MSTQIAIAQSGIAAQAFIYMEMSPISSLADETEKAEAARAVYPQALNMLLEQADWSFASKRRDLLQTEVPANVGLDPTMPYFFKRPADAVILREVGDGHTRWELLTDHLRADVPGPLSVRYTAQIADETRLSAQFRDAVALQLAVLLSGLFVPTHTKRDALARMLQEKTLLALQVDARNASPRPWQMDRDHGDWVREALQ